MVRMTRILFLFGLLITGLYIISCSTAPGSGSGGGGTSSSSSGALVLGPGIYVATNGNDANSGTNSAEPLKTIQTAISTAVSLGFTNLYAAQGVYSPGNGLNPVTNGVMITNNNINLIGGFSGDFTSRAGRSMLDGTNGLDHVIKADKTANIKIDGFILINGNAVDAATSDTFGGGLFFNSVKNSLVTNTTVSNCHANNGGGGMIMNLCTNNIISALFYGNNSANLGGALYIYMSQSNLISSSIISNSAAANGGGIYIDSSAEYNMITGNISVNSAGGYGGGIYCEGDNLLITNAVISSNTALLGGGITLSGAGECAIFAVISGNSCPNDGGGILMRYCSSNFINSTLIGNRAVSGGGIETFWSSNIMISGVFTGNGALNGSGGGIYVWNGLNTIVSANFAGNFATNSKGGAVYFEASTNSTLINSVLTNNWSYTGFPYGNAVVTTGFNMGPFMMSNCTIGGSLNKTGQGIYGFVEDTDLTNHLLLDNKFLTNNLDFLYLDGALGYLVVTNKADWTNINNTAFTGAAAASGNTVE